MRTMSIRSTACASALAVAAGLVAMPAVAQESKQPEGQQQPASPSLQQAREQLRAAARQLEQARQGQDSKALDQAKANVRQAVEGVRQAMSQLSPAQRAELQENLRQAEQGMQTTNPASLAEAVQRLDRASASSSDAPVVALSTWRYDPLYRNGWRTEEIWDAEVYGPESEQIGEIENLLLGPDGRILSVVAEVGGLWDIGDTHVNVPWNEVKIGPGFDRITIPVNEDNVENYSVFRDWHLTHAEAMAETTSVGDDLTLGPKIWKLTDILDDYVVLNSGEPYGYVNDVVFNREGDLEAILVRPDVRQRQPGYYAYPYPAWWTPGLNYHVLPYDRADIEALTPFDPDRLEGGQSSQG